MNQHLGEFAALGTAVSWTVGALVFETATRRAGVMAVNTLKVLFGSLYLMVLALCSLGQFFPLHAGAANWLLMGLSGVVGFVIGDYFLFHAYALVGSRLGMLLMSASVPLTAAAGWLIYGEALGPWALAGMAATVGGITLTVLTGKPAHPEGHEHHVSRADYRKGVAYGGFSAVAMAAGTLLSKAGAVGIPAVAATQIRILAALAGFIVVALAGRKTAEIRAAVRDRRSLGLIALGAVFGPFIGVTLLLFALQNASAGIVSTITSLTPVLIIVPSVVVFRRRVGPLEIAGSCIAVAGVSLLVL
jgi:drug/metabolite transporter (DMT)-like permease